MSVTNSPFYKVPTIRMSENTWAVIKEEDECMQLFQGDTHILINFDEVNSLIKNLQKFKEKYIEK